MQNRHRHGSRAELALFKERSTEALFLPTLVNKVVLTTLPRLPARSWYRTRRLKSRQIVARFRRVQIIKRGSRRIPLSLIPKHRGTLLKVPSSTSWMIDIVKFWRPYTWKQSLAAKAPQIRKSVTRNNVVNKLNAISFVNTLHTSSRTPRYSLWKSSPHTLAYHNAATVTSYIRHFRLATSEIITMVPIRRQILRYNLMHIFNPLTTVRRIEFFGFGMGLLHHNDRTPNYRARRVFRKPLTRRRITVLWLAHHTRLAITPQRHEFMILYRKRFQYQRKLTTFMLTFYRFKVVEAVQNYEFNIVLFLIRTWIVPSVPLAKAFISWGWIFVNGVRLYRPNISLYGGDVVQVQISKNFYIMHRWNIITHRLRLVKFRHFANYWHTRTQRPYPKDTSHRIPHWVIHNKIIVEEVPPYVEIDFVTLSALILRIYVNNASHYHYFSLHETPFASIRAYNWKSYT